MCGIVLILFMMRLRIEKWVTRDSAVSCSAGGYCLHFEGAKAERKTKREGGRGRQQRAADEYGMQVGGFCSLFQGKTFHFLSREDGLISNGNREQEFISEKRNVGF